jgi:hypothetical protein
VHLDWLVDWLAGQGTINILSIGYSGMDLDVLDLVAKTDCDVKTALAVCGDGAAARQALNRMGERLGFEMDVSHQLCSGGFAATMVSDEFSAWITRVGAGERIPAFLGSTLDALGVERDDPDPLYEGLYEKSDLAW